MRKIVFLSVFMLMFACGTVLAEEVYSPITEYDLSITSTTAKSQSATYSGVSWFPVVDLYRSRPNLGVFSIQVYQATMASGTITTASSGNTYYLYYTVSNKDDAGLWAKAGITAICGPIPLSGSTAVVQTFTPEFAKYLKVGVLASGNTAWGTFKTNLEVQ